MFVEFKIKEFLDKVSSSDPTPGGGSVSALNVALGCASALLMANITLGKEKFMNVQNEIQKIIIELEEIKKNASLLIDKDKEAYDTLVNAFKMKKETDEEKEMRKKAIFDATVFSTKVPIDITKCALNASNIILQLIEIGNKKAISDALTGLFNCYCGAISSLTVAKLNLSGSWDNPEVKANFISEVKMLEIEIENLFENIKKVISTHFVF